MKTTICRSVLMKNGTELDVELEVEYNASYSRATMYSRGGDPGDPAEAELDVESIRVVSATDENGDESSIPSEEITRRVDSLHSDYIKEECWEDFFSRRNGG